MKENILTRHDVMVLPVENLNPCWHCINLGSNGTNIPENPIPGPCGYLILIDDIPTCRRLQLEITKKDIE